MATEKPCVFDVSRRDKAGGYPLSSLRYPIVLSLVSDTLSNVGGLLLRAWHPWNLPERERLPKEHRNFHACRLLAQLGRLGN